MDRASISLVLTSLRHSVEGRYTANRRSLPDEDSWKAAVLKVEALRVDFSLRRPPGFGSNDEIQRVARLRGGLIDLLHDESFVRYIDGLRFRPSVGQRLRERMPPEFVDGDLGIEDAIRLFADLLSGVGSIDRDGQPELALGRLREIVPDQKIAPAKFDIVSGRLVLIDQPAAIDPDDVNNVRSARDAILAKGEKIIDELSRSNCDRRVIESISEVQNGLRANNNIIELGLLNVGYSAVCGAAADELPDAIRGMIEGHTTSISMFVAQFPEWQRFTEKAASINIDSNDASRIAQSANEIASQIEDREDLADPEVPKTIRFLATLVRDPTNTSKRAAFAALRTIENLVSKIMSYSLDLVEKTTTKTINGLSTATSRVIVVGLMALAISSVTSLGPVTSKIAESSWMRTAVEIVKKQIKSL